MMKPPSHHHHQPDAYEQRYMKPEERVLFREKVVSRAAFGVSVVFAALFGIFGLGAVVVGVVSAVPAPLIAMGALCVFFGAAMGILGVMFSVFRTMVTADHVYVHFGWVKRKIPLDAIDSIRDLRLTGLRQGKVSIGLDGVVRTWAGHSASGRGVEITYHEGSQKHVLTFGSEDAAHFVQTVEQARAPKRVETTTEEEVVEEDDESESENEDELLEQRREN